jgi:hypothetical protein
VFIVSGTPYPVRGSSTRTDLLSRLLSGELPTTAATRGWVLAFTGIDKTDVSLTPYSVNQILFLYSTRLFLHTQVEF